MPSCRAIKSGCPCFIPLIATISLQQQSLPNTSQALWDDLPRLKYTIFEGINSIYYLRCSLNDFWWLSFKSFELELVAGKRKVHYVVDLQWVARFICLIYIFGAFFGAVVVHIVLAFFNRCPHCNKCLTIQGFKSPHPASSGDWSKVVWHWFSGSIVCIHCGNRVNTNGL